MHCGVVADRARIQDAGSGVDAKSSWMNSGAGAGEECDAPYAAQPMKVVRIA